MSRVAGPQRSDSDDQEEPVADNIAASPAQIRSLDTVRDVAGVTIAEHLLASTGPSAEMTAAQMRGVLDASCRELIAKKGAGVVFEAETVVRLQDASERYGLALTARLATKANSPRADLLLFTSDGQVEFQLKTGSDRYLRAAVRARAEGVVLLVPADVSVNERSWAAATTSTIEIDGIQVDSPTREELHAHSQKALDRIARGESAFSLGELAESSLANSFVDGLTAIVVDVSCQVLSNPEAPIDWTRAAKSLAKTAVTSAASSFLSGVLARTSLIGSGRALDATACMRASRVTSCVVPRALDSIFDLVRLDRGEIDEEEFHRQLARNAGAAAFELAGFHLLSRLTAKLGRVGRTIVMVVGGMVLAMLGAAAGEAVYRLFSGSQPKGHPQGASPSEPATAEIPALSMDLVNFAREEHARRVARAEKKRCGESGCRRRHHAKGLCGTHYMRWWRRNRAFMTAMDMNEMLDGDVHRAGNDEMRRTEGQLIELTLSV